MEAQHPPPHEPAATEEGHEPERTHRKEHKKHKKHKHKHKKHKKRLREEGEGEGEEGHAGAAATATSEGPAGRSERSHDHDHNHDHAERHRDNKKKKKSKKRQRLEEAQPPSSARPAQDHQAEGGEAEEEDEEEATPRTAAGLAGFSAAARARFPELSAEQWAQLEQLGALVQEWNGKVNVISRKDIENVLPRHVLPCMGIAKLLHRAPPGTRLMDVGTGGGFPGLPLAICCPQVRFLLVDSIGKKIKVVADMAKRLGLRNVEARHARVEDVREKLNFVTGRSVTAMPRFVGWVQGKFVNEPLAASAALLPEAEAGGVSITGGILYIKGGIGEDAAGQAEDLGGWVPTRRFPITELIGGGPRVYDGDKAVLHFDLDCLRKGPRAGGGGGIGGGGGGGAKPR